jgi:hypothetical protein
MSKIAKYGSIIAATEGIGKFKKIVKNDPTIVNGIVATIPFLIAIMCRCVPILFAKGINFCSIEFTNLSIF